MLSSSSHAGVNPDLAVEDLTHRRPPAALTTTYASDLPPSSQMSPVFRCAAPFKCTTKVPVSSSRDSATPKVLTPSPVPESAVAATPLDAAAAPNTFGIARRIGKRRGDATPRGERRSALPGEAAVRRVSGGNGAFAAAPPGAPARGVAGGGSGAVWSSQSSSTRGDSDAATPRRGVAFSRLALPSAESVSRGVRISLERGRVVGWRHRPRPDRRAWPGDTLERGLVAPTRLDLRVWLVGPRIDFRRRFRPARK